MSEERKIRINTILRYLNILLERAVDFLKDNGYLIEPSPNAKISEIEFKILCNHFDSKNLNIRSDAKFDELMEKTKIEKLIKLDQYKNLHKDVYDDVVLLLNSLRNNLFELNITLQTLENNKIVVQQKILISDFKGGFTELRSITNSLSLRWYNKKCVLKIENIEVNFLGGKFPVLSEKNIAAIIHAFKKSSFFSKFEINPENELFQINEIISKLNPYDCLAILIVSNKLKASNIEKLKKTYTISEKTKNEFDKENPFEKDILETLKEEYANGIIFTKITFGIHYLESEFFNFPAFQICRGIKNKEHLHQK